MKDEKPRTDWGEVRRRIEAVGRALEQRAEIDAAAARKMLTARAKELAREPESTPEGESIEIIEFLLSYEKYGIQASFVREVVPLKDLTRVPCTPAFVLGIVNVRGRILSVIDLKKFFDLPEKGLTDLNKLVILRSGGMEFCVVADAITGTRTVRIDQLQPAPPTFTGAREAYLKGILPDGTVILDGRELLSDKKIIVNEDV